MGTGGSRAERAAAADQTAAAAAATAAGAGAVRPEAHVRRGAHALSEAHARQAGACGHRGAQQCGDPQCGDRGRGGGGHRHQQLCQSLTPKLPEINKYIFTCRKYKFGQNTACFFSLRKGVKNTHFLGYKLPEVFFPKVVAVSQIS